MNRYEITDSAGLTFQCMAWSADNAIYVATDILQNMAEESGEINPTVPVTVELV